jgi:8-oxo-dGTP diphosphatase
MLAVADHMAGDAGGGDRGGYRAAVPVYLIRHAHAGSRSDWRGDDRERPISAKGRAQEASLRKRLADQPVGRVLSSPSRRCIETVEGIADDVGVEVEIRPELDEGSDPDAALALLTELTDTNPVICSHGDLLPKLLRRFTAAGMKTKDASISQKGSLWVIEMDDGRPAKGRYYPPA